MNELKATKPKRPMDPSNMNQDSAVLNGLLAMVNDPNITGAVVPKGENVRVPLRKIPEQPSPASMTTETLIEAASTMTGAVAGLMAASAPAAPESVSVPRNRNRIFFTGRLCSGKDNAAEAAGLQILGLADPLYFLVNRLFNLKVSATEGKDIPGVRATLQLLGQWGRGDYTDKSPATPARAVFLDFLRDRSRALNEAYPSVRWGDYGNSQDIWLNAAIRRADEMAISNPAAVAITNVRFENEYKRLTAEGWTHYHVMCSAKTWQQRLATKNMRIDNPALKDTSEQLAIALDNDVMRRLKMGTAGSGMLRVIWNDSEPAPSKRLHTVQSWIQSLNALPAVPSVPDISQE